MSVISQDKAKEIARKLCLKHSEAADKILEHYKLEVFNEYNKTIPKDVSKMFGEHPEFFRTAKTICVVGNGFSHEQVYTPKEKNVINNSGNYYAIFKPLKAIVDKLVDAKRNSEKAQENYKKLYKETVQALLTLKTTKRITDEFPEAVPFFPNPVYPVPVVINLEKLRKEFKLTKKTA